MIAFVNRKINWILSCFLVVSKWNSAQLNKEHLWLASRRQWCVPLRAGCEWYHWLTWQTGERGRNHAPFCCKFVRSYCIGQEVWWELLEAFSATLEWRQGHLILAGPANLQQMVLLYPILSYDVPDWVLVKMQQKWTDDGSPVISLGNRPISIWAKWNFRGSTRCVWCLRLNTELNQTALKSE